MNKRGSSAQRRKSAVTEGAIEGCCGPAEDRTGSLKAGHRLIPFLLHSAGQEWVVNDLCAVLNQRGCTSLLCHMDETSDAPRADLDQQLHGLVTPHGYCLLPVMSAQTILAQNLDHLVMLVPANLDAVRSAYRKIKLLAAGKTPEIGIVMVGPRDQHAAWRYFRKLGIGTLRYLDVPLLNLGFLPEQVTPQHSPDRQHRETFLTRISERLTRSDFFSSLMPHEPEETV